MLVSAVAVLTVALVGSLLSWVIAHQWIGQPAPGRGNAYFYLFGRYELPHLVLLGGSTVSAALYCLAPAPPPAAAKSEGWLPSARPMLVALGVVVIAWLGSRLALHGFPLSMDEFNAVFQSRIFASGRVTAEVPPQWRELVPAIKPIFVTYRADDGTWLSGYLPVYAALRAAFLKVGLDSLVNPLLGGIAVLGLAAVARRLWPGPQERMVLAIIVLATSSQFLVTSMTQYAMPAQLLANLCWLLLYLRGGRAFLWAPWLGALALGLNNPFPHALFVAPFLLRMLLDGRRAECAYFTTVYALGSVAWLAWWGYALPADSSDRMAGMFGLPDPVFVATQMMNLALFISWQTPVMALGLGVALLCWRRLGVVERDLAAGLLLTFGFYVFFEQTQGHGWGYRYLHPVLGSGALLAATGLQTISNVTNARRFRLVVAASVLISVLAQVPFRLLTVERFVAPWAKGAEYIASLPAEAVVVPTAQVWYGYDFVRNDPFFTAPIVVSSGLGQQAPLDLARLAELVGGRIHVLHPEELARFGVPTGSSN